MDHVLQVEQLTKTYGKGARTVRALDGVSFQSGENEILGLLGPNGAGKTTAVKIICGLIEPTSGRAVVEGQDVAHSRARTSAAIGAVLEGNRNIYWQLTPLENLEYFGALRGVPGKLRRARAIDLLKLFDLYDRRNVSVNDLSRGMQQKLAIAVALIHDPSLLLLDEPTLGLDLSAALKVKEQIELLSREQGKTILLTTHQLEMVRDLCHRVIVLDSGRIVAQDQPASLITAMDQLELEVIVRGPLPDECCAAIAQIAGATARVQSANGATHIHAAFHDPSALYVLMEALKPRPIISIREIRDPLGQVILQCATHEKQPTEASEW